MDETDVGSGWIVVQNCIPSWVAVLLGQWRLMEKVWGPWCGRLGSHAGEQEKVAEQGSDFMKVGNGIFLFMPRILMNVLPAQMLGWGLCTDSLLTVQE